MKAIFAIFSTILFSTPAFCETMFFSVKPAEVQQADTSTLAAPISAPSQIHDGFAARGLRIAYVKPFLTATNKSNLLFGNNGRGEAIDQANGVAVGYAYLPINRLGYTANVSYLDLLNNKFDIGLIRVDANVAYALTPTLNVKTGANYSEFNRKDFRSSYSGLAGFQASLGLQLNKNFGIDAGAVLMRQKEKAEGALLSEAGPEVSLAGTF